MHLWRQWVPRAGIAGALAVALAWAPSIVHAGGPDDGPAGGLLGALGEALDLDGVLDRDAQDGDFERYQEAREADARGQRDREEPEQPSLGGPVEEVTGVVTGLTEAVAGPVLEGVVGEATEPVAETLDEVVEAVAEQAPAVGELLPGVLEPLTEPAARLIHALATPDAGSEGALVPAVLDPIVEAILPRGPGATQDPPDGATSTLGGGPPASEVNDSAAPASERAAVPPGSSGPAVPQQPRVPEREAPAPASTPDRVPRATPATDLARATAASDSPAGLLPALTPTLDPETIPDMSRETRVPLGNAPASSAGARAPPGAPLAGGGGSPPPSAALTGHHPGSPGGFVWSHALSEHLRPSGWEDAPLTRPG